MGDKCGLCVRRRLSGSWISCPRLRGILRVCMSSCLHVFMSGQSPFVSGLFGQEHTTHAHARAPARSQARSLTLTHARTLCHSLALFSLSLSHEHCRLKMHSENIQFFALHTRTHTYRDGKTLREDAVDFYDFKQAGAFEPRLN